MAELSELLGKTVTDIEQVDNRELIFTLDDGRKYKLHHLEGCCEKVDIEDITGEIGDLLNSPLLMAEEVTYKGENPKGVAIPKYQDSFTWTFYKFATIQGYVTVRWYGASNGYYSERVDFHRDDEWQFQY